ncbi:MAG: multidrug effflux MFS transporter [Bauldia sp.]|nr:multidrug effflux MFS transporter [Bauldia sp.]
MTSQSTRYAIVLGLLSAVGPFAIDMYLPALPSISDDLGATTAATQMTLMVFFITFGLSQLVYGPVSDMIGRKRPLYFGLALFAAGAIGSGLSPSIEWLIFFRFVQGIGAAACAVTPRAIIRDLHTGVEAARLMAMVMLVFSVSPILAPLIGSGIIVPFGWRAVFVAVFFVAVLAIALVAWALPETLPAERRASAGLGSVLSGFGKLLRDPRFLGLTFIGGLGISSFFTFLANSSFVYIEHYGLTPTEFSLAFSINAVGFIGASQFAARIARRYGFAKMILRAVTAYAAFAVSLFLLTLAGADWLVVLMVGLFLSFACLGLVIPTTMVMALEEHGPIAGMASALGGTLQFLTGAVMISIASVIFDGTSLPMVGIIAACSLGALTLAVVTLGRRTPAPAAAE